MAKFTKKSGSASKAAKPESSARKGFYGKTSGLSVGPFAVQLFKDNYAAKLDDAKLFAALEREFPDRDKPMYPVVGLRSQFNRGGLAGQDAAPSRPLPRYENGAPVEGRTHAKKDSGGTAKKASGKKKVKASGGKKVVKNAKTGLKQVVSAEGKS